MLKLIHIKKDYLLKEQEPVHALKDISINFRKNEFVSILGPSGCGKTTLLNIIGGLLRFDDGDLIIKNKSTKFYKDGDWDTYRNHSIGFVFQSYNLIGHQSILSNVELALTIAGLDKKERKERSKAALDKVGLKGLYKKKPNQLSGGQMQRVAIARALVNNPEILLADEPTGALDSETSIQIMDLLKEVAKDRLVIMVTHNPDLAEKYSTRIINMFDGLITGDNHPYNGEDYQEEATNKPVVEPSKGKKKKTSMSFFTATGLSFSNLISKFSRTLLIAIAGSIGIIGVSSVLAISHGVRGYIDGMQDDMLSRYPISIQEQAVDYTSLVNGLSSWDDKKIKEFDLKTEVGLDSMINYLMDKYKDLTSIKQNDINEDLITYVNELDAKDVSSISLDYGFDMTNNIFTTWQRDDTENEQIVSLNGLTQMYIAELKTVDGFAEYAMFVDLFTNFMKLLPGDEDYILSQYNLLGNSRFPQSANEIVLVVDENQTLTDLVYAQMGYYQETDFLNLCKKAIKENDSSAISEDIDELTYPESFKYDELLNKKLYYKKHDNLWKNSVVDTQQRITLSSAVSFPGFGDVPIDLVVDLTSDNNLKGSMKIAGAIEKEIEFVKETEPLGPSKPWINNYSGTLSMEFMGISFVYDFIINLIDDTHYTGSYTNEAFGINNDVSGEYTYSKYVAEGYNYHATLDNLNDTEEVKIVGILKRKDDINFGCLNRGVYYTDALARKMLVDSLNSAITSNFRQHMLSKENELYQTYVTFEYTSYKDADHPVKNNFGYASALNSDLSSSMSEMFSISGTTTKDINKAHLRSISGLACKDNSGLFKYDFRQLPKKVTIYPKSFENKKNITSYLDRWNSDEMIRVNDKDLSKDQRQELTYTDTIEIIINIINTLILTITIALVAFTSLALVVSCFMIAVITYISTMERFKEIGVIRSLGGRKKDVSRLFIAECLITGLSSGLIGVVVTYILSIIANLVVSPFGISQIAFLPLTTALIMVTLSIVLNVLSGLIPSMKASKQDPVIALRTE